MIYHMLCQVCFYSPGLLLYPTSKLQTMETFGVGIRHADDMQNKIHQNNVIKVVWNIAPFCHLIVPATEYVTIFKYNGTI